MPGLTLHVTTPADGSEDARFHAAQGVMLHGPSYDRKVLAGDASFRCGYVAYPGYPVRSFSGGEDVVVLEGRVYNKPQRVVETELRELGEALGRNDEFADRVRRWTAESQGSYLVLVVKCADRRLALFSDPFGRLPVYVAATGQELVVSREVKFVRQFAKRGRWDPIGWAQWLSLGLAIGARTLYEGIDALPDGALLVASWGGEGVDVAVRSLVEWNLDDEIRHVSLARHATEFVDRFVPACRDWGSHEEAAGNVVSLSGGHDSRFVAAGMARAGLPVQAVSYEDPNGRRHGEVTCAEALTTALAVPWGAVALPAPTDQNRLRLVRLKDGLNWSTMGYILPYLELLLERFGPRAVYLTGDGGNDCLDVCAPDHSLDGLNAASAYVVSELIEIQPAVAESILRLPAGTVRDSVRERLASYPEGDLRRRIKHYKIFERGRRCYFEGEDRARFFLWEDSPFYALPLFEYCARVPDSEKMHNRFCRAALAALSPAAASVPVFPLGVAPASAFYVAANRAQAAGLLLPPAVRAVIRAALRRPRLANFEVGARAIDSMIAKVRRSERLDAVIDVDALARVLPLLGAASEYYLLWTLLHLEDCE